LKSLTREDLVRVMTEPRNAIVRQYQEFFEIEGCEMVITPDGLEAIAGKVLREETGVRALRSIIENMLLDLRFKLPTLAAEGPVKVTIDAACVRGETEPEVTRRTRPAKKGKLSRKEEPPEATEPEAGPEERESA
jgi:ATP-dependent Clp protease ATP-binding subunit ClpX